MFKKNIFFLVLALSVFTAAAQQKQAPLNGAEQPARKVLKQIKKGKAYLIDVRTPEEFSTGHLQYAQNIDLKSTDFKTSIAKLDKQKPVYLYCRTGNRSGKALDTLKTLGFSQFYNIGGFSNLTVAGFTPVY